MKNGINRHLKQPEPDIQSLCINIVCGFHRIEQLRTDDSLQTRLTVTMDMYDFNMLHQKSVNK